MTKVYRANGIDLGDTVVRLGSETGYNQFAEMGNVGSSTVIVDDVNGNLDIPAWKRFTVDENAASAGNQRLYTGFVKTRTFQRGDSSRPSLRTAASRQITCELVDLNALASEFLAITGSDGKRPKETAGARLTWLLASTYITIFDNGFVTYPTNDMDAADYRGQHPADVLNDIALGDTGRNWFIYYDETADQDSLWFRNSNTSTSYPSSLTISDVLSDNHANPTTCWPPLYDAQLVSDPTRVASQVYDPYANGVSIKTLAATATAFAARTLIGANSNVKSKTAADAISTRLLTDNSTEDFRITCVIRVPAAHVNDIKAGQLMSAKFSEFTNYTLFSSFRVMSCTPIQDEETDALYTISLLLSPATPTTPGVCPYDCTATQSTYPLGTSKASDGIAYYYYPGLAVPEVPNPGWIGNWHFGTFGAGGVGTTDYAGDCAQNAIRFLFVGNGTLVIHTSVFGGQAETFTVLLTKIHGVVKTTTTLATLQPIGTDYTVIVSDRTAPLDCIWYVDIRDFTKSPTACGSKIGYTGADYTSAGDTCGVIP